MAVVRGRSIVELARGNEERLRIELDATRDRERFGDLAKTDIFQAESRHEASAAGRTAAEGELAVATADFARLVGETPGDLVTPSLPDSLPATLDQALA